MKISLPHQGTQAEGIAHIKTLIEQHRTELEKNASEIITAWQDNVLTFAFDAQKMHIEGTLTVRDRVFDLYAKLPLALRLFEGRIEKMIADEAKKLAV